MLDAEVVVTPGFEFGVVLDGFDNRLMATVYSDRSGPRNHLCIVLVTHCLEVPMELLPIILIQVVGSQVTATPKPPPVMIGLLVTHLGWGPGVS